MICLTCKRQIPDDSTECPNCGSSIDHQLQVVHEIKIRRFQRWIFYTIMTLMFLGMVGVVVWVYNENNKLLLSYNNAQTKLSDTEKSLMSKEGELSSVKNELTTKDKQYQDVNTQLSDAKKAKEDDIKKVTAEKDKIDSELKQCYLDDFMATANVYSLINKLGKPLGANDLSKIAVGLDNLDGTDTDSDGLPDNMEAALGTNKDKLDTDDDKYSDFDELSRNFNPLGLGRLPIDSAYAKKYKGLVVLQSEHGGAAWYVSSDGKRYFLGNVADAFKAMRSSEYWVKDWRDRSSKAAESETADASPVAAATASNLNDNKRIGDIKQIQTALELYYNDMDKYPVSLEDESMKKYLAEVPQSPNPPDGSCTNEQNLYSYLAAADGSAYTLNFCLGTEAGGISAGVHKASPSGIAQ